MAVVPSAASSGISGASAAARGARCGSLRPKVLGSGGGVLRYLSSVAAGLGWQNVVLITRPFGKGQRIASSTISWMIP